MNVPSGYTALDLIGFTDRGNYDSTANYVKNDLVHHNNSIWKCLVDDTTAVTPAEGANWAVYIQNGTTLNGMADVNLTTPANGDLLRYNSTSSKWENQDVDSTPKQSSTKLVQSGGVYTQLEAKANTADLATVATTGAYSDLSGAPPLAAVATSGAYSDLTGQPTIPTVNDATLTIQKNGTNVETFTANSSTNKTANITVPDVINDLSDVNISSVANEEILAYDSASSKWKNSGALGALKETLTNEVEGNWWKGGKNLYEGSPFFEGYRQLSFWTKTSETYNGHDVYKRSGEWSGVYKLIYLIEGTYTFSVAVKTNDSASVGIFGTMNNEAMAVITPTQITSVSTSTSWQRKSFTFTVTQAGTVALRIERKTDGDIYISEYQIEKGNSASSYTPYAATNQQLTGLISNDFTNGAVNLYKPLISSQVVKGVTFTVNSDGTISTSGTSNAVIYFSLEGDNSFQMPTGRYHLSGCPSGGGTYTTFFMYLQDMTATQLVGQDNGTGVDVDLINGHLYRIFIFVGYQSGTGANMNGKVFKPMLTVADMPNSDYNHYVPYAKSNKELTDELSIKTLTDGAWDASIDGSKAITIKKYGKIVTVYGRFRATTSLPIYTHIYTGLPYCESGAATSFDGIRFSLEMYNNKSDIVIQAATTANAQYSFSYTYLTSEE